MARSQANRKLSPVERTLKAPARLGQDGEACQIVFGYNADEQKVLLQFSVAAPCLIFSPDDARAVAKQLTHYADMADGKKTQA